MTDYLRGSEWRKWDLHVHTPVSYDYKNKSVSYEDLAQRINASDLDAIAITDHWSLEGYRQLKGLISTGKLLLPGIEIKVDKNTKGKSNASGGLHALVIFPENLDLEDIESKFLHKIHLCEEEGKIPTLKDLIALGKKVGKAGKLDDDYLALGQQQAYADFNQVTKLAHSLGGLVVLTYDRHGGFEGIDPIDNSALKGNLLKGADLLETLKDEVRIAHFERKDIIRAGGKKTPCIKGSDAHYPAEIGSHYTWIKGEKSLEGLRQTVYFPKERVSFSERKPGYTYPRIRKIQLKKVSSGHPLSSLDSIPIPVSDNLTTLIGHPSIGKSTFAEVVAFLFDTESGAVKGEDESKIEHLQSLNPALHIEAEVLIGDTTNTLTRNLDGSYGGSLAVDEVPVTYLNQGYIDRTARDADKVAELILNKMDSTEFESASTEVNETLNNLKLTRNAYMQKASLLEEQQDIKKKLAAANKFFVISKSTDYKELEETRQKINDKQSQMKSAIEDVENLSETFQAYEEQFDEIKLEPSLLSTLFPSVKSDQLKVITDFPPKATTYLANLKRKLETSKELREVVTQKKDLMTKIKQLFADEGITYTDNLYEKKNEEIIALETRKRKNDAEITACLNRVDEFDTELASLTQYVANRDQVTQAALTGFNNGLINVEVRYEDSNLEEWLTEVLTDEAKEAWDNYTPPVDKKDNQFTKPAVEYIQGMFKKLNEEGKKTPKQIKDHLIKCLEAGTLPIKQEHEFIKWLFGDKSEVIKDFLKMRLKEHVNQGKLQLYFAGKNIAREGLSYTERCGALLEIIVEKGVEPLIIDQPEENLGSGYITGTLIPTILEKKHSRQIILVSHNPNTVVLADSDLVIAFDRDGDSDDIDLHSGAIESDGMKEIICDIIEGGTEAFKVRVERYKIH